MQPVPDPYRQLGVQRGATLVQIKAAHRSLAKRFHPDAPEGDSTRFLAIQEAYLLLSDPLRRRDWDARHAPGPVRAGAAPQGRATRPRTASGRWTREDAEANARRTRAPGSGRASAGRGTSGGAGTAGTPGDASGRSRGATGASGAPRGTASTRGSGATRGQRGTTDEETRRADAAWSQSGREASSRSYTWSAERVPWWEDFTPRGQAAGPSGQTAGARATGSRKRANPGAASSGEAGPNSSKAADGPSSGRAGTRRKTSTGDAEPSSGAGTAGTRAPDGGATAPGPSASRPSSPDVDVYSRSSGAAWSMAARRYFRKGDADLPSRGSFVYRGTQVVTGAEARQVKEDEARRRSAADDLLRPRPGTKAPRQAFDHSPEREDRSTRRPPARPAQAPPSKPDDAGDRATAARSGSGADPNLTRQSTAASRSAATARTKDADAIRDASMGASAIIGAVAALLVSTPIVLVGGVVLAHPIEPLFTAVVILLAALSGGIAAAAWEAGRQRNRPR